MKLLIRFNGDVRCQAARGPCPPSLHIRRHPLLRLFATEMQPSGLLMKLAAFFGMVLQRAGGHPDLPARHRCRSKLITQPVEALADPADEGLVRMLLEVELIEKAVQVRNCGTQLPAGFGQNHEVIHETAVAQVFLPGEETVDLVQLESRQQRAQRRATTDALTRRMEGATEFDAVMDHLGQQTLHDGVLNMHVQLRDQSRLACVRVMASADQGAGLRKAAAPGAPR